MSDTGKDRLFEQLAVVGKAFANAKRLELIDLLAQGERTVESLAHSAGLGVSTTSAHLQVLKLASVVTTRREGTRIHYRLAGDDVAAVYAALGSIAREHSPDVERARESYLGLRGVAPDVEELTRDQLLARMADGEVAVLDVRPADEYAAGHIPGALSMPFGDLVEGISRLDPDIEVVAYCRGAYCVLAHDAVRLLHHEGRRATRLQDGWLEWRLAGLPVAVGAS
ncbi:MAG TPA: metalloregulator ArsR/SmtB family transcription factor [Angustibacter sp.]|nr:metalloregulator ArsR/SmtB family transcription factor [Angustibacter sp.]